MKVEVLLFASCSDIVGSRKLDLEIAQDASVQGLVDNLLATYPRLSGIEKSMMISVNQEYVTRDQSIKDGDEVALIPPVSGGSGFIFDRTKYA